MNEEMKNTYKMLISRYEVQKPLGRPSCRWEFKVILKPWERGCGMDLVVLSRDC